MAIIKKIGNKKYWGGCGKREKRTLAHFWLECKFVEPLWKTIWFLKKLRIELPFDRFIIYRGQDTETNCVPMAGWMIKMWYTLTHTEEYYSAVR